MRYGICFCDPSRLSLFSCAEPMGRQSDINHAVAAIYDAALQPEIWPEVLSQIGKIVGSEWLVMGALRFNGQTDLTVQDESQDDEVLTLFQKKYNSPATNPAIPLLLAKGPGSIVLREEEMSDEEWHRSGLYRDLYRPAGLYHGLGTFVLKTDSHVVFLGLNRRKKRGRFVTEDLDVIRYFLVHVQGAMQIFLRLADLEPHRTAQETLWNKLPFGVILLDRQGTVLWSNRTAAAITTQADGLAVMNGRISAANSAENADLQALVRTAIATNGDVAPITGSSMRVSRPSLARPFELTIAPLRIVKAFVRG